MPIQKARDIIMSLKPQLCSPRIMEERPTCCMSTGGRELNKPANFTFEMHLNDLFTLADVFCNSLLIAFE